MKLFHDSEKAAEIEAKIAEKFYEEREHRDKIHVSDTCHCPYKFFWRITGLVEPLPEDKKGVGKMTLGAVGQRIIQNLFPPEHVEVEHDFMPSHTDVLEEGKTPIEVKYSAMRIFRSADVPKSWILQLMAYMTIHFSNVGWLLIMNVLSGQWSAFKMYLTNEEISNHLAYLQKFNSLGYQAVEEKNPDILDVLVPYVFENDEERKKECKFCKYRPGRKRDKLNLGSGCTKYLGGRSTA